MQMVIRIDHAKACLYSLVVCGFVFQNLNRNLILKVVLVFATQSRR